MFVCLSITLLRLLYMGRELREGKQDVEIGADPYSCGPSVLVI